MMTIRMTDADFEAMQAYATQHGRKWKDRLILAWLNDWREQWGILRSIRNNPKYFGEHGLTDIFKLFENERKARKENKQ